LDAIGVGIQDALVDGAGKLWVSGERGQPQPGFLIVGIYRQRGLEREACALVLPTLQGSNALVKQGTHTHILLRDILRAIRACGHVIRWH
jgi:hypothetical protein